jgi:DNA-binding transcriptional LysR family regulator
LTIQAIVAAYQEALEHEVSDQSGTPRGHLRVSAPTFFGAEILSRHLAEFHRRYPEISLELSLENRFVDMVAERFDVAVRMAAPRDSSLVMRKLSDIPLLACASPGYLERHGRPAVPEDLAHHACLLYTLTRRTHEGRFRREDGALYSVTVDGRIHTNDDHAQRQAAIDGLGILYMPALFLEEAIECGDLVPLWPAAMMPTVTLALVYPSRHALPARVRAFVDFVAGLFRA